jgi:hypothetical protein
VPRDAPNVGVNQAAEKYHRASTAVGIAGNVLGGFEIQNKTLGLLDGGRAAAKIGIVTRPLGAVLVPLEHGLEGISEVKNGAPIAPVAAGVVGKTAVQGTGILAGTGLGLAVGSLIPGVGSIAGAIGGATSNEAFGRKVQSAMESFGRYPYYDGGVGWPVFPRK